MCITFIYVNHNVSSNAYKLIIASNRDETFERETKPLHLWSNGHIIGGQDAVKGGTWLAASKKGKIGLLLNVLGENSRPNGKDRGPIVIKYLESSLSANEYLEVLKQDTENQVYNGFHTVLFELSKNNTSIHHFSNIQPLNNDKTRITKFPTDNQVYGFGNSQCISKPFKKVEHGKQKFGEIIKEFNDIKKSELLIENILKLMKNKQSYYPDAEVDRKAEVDMNEDYKRKYSAICVDIPTLLYGTRTHSIILVDKDNNLNFHEWTLENYESQQWAHTHIEEKLDLS